MAKQQLAGPAPYSSSKAKKGWVSSWRRQLFFRRSVYGIIFVAPAMIAGGPLVLVADRRRFVALPLIDGGVESVGVTADLDVAAGARAATRVPVAAAARTPTRRSHLRRCSWFRCITDLQTVVDRRDFMRA